jgi:L1 cell adhesion molecule like protein
MPRGQPQIEISYDLDANGILSVTAAEKSTGVKQDIQITNDKNRLSKEQIEKMVAEAEQFKEEDQLNKDKIESKNTLESMFYSVKSSISNEKLKITDSDKEKITEKVTELEEWLLAHPDETKEVYDSKVKELEEVFQPIMTEAYKNMEGGGMPGMPDMSGMSGMPDMAQMEEMMKNMNINKDKMDVPTEESTEPVDVDVTLPPVIEEID